MTSPGRQLKKCANDMKELLEIWSTLEKEVILELRTLQEILGENLKSCAERLELELADQISDILSESKNPLSAKEIAVAVGNATGDKPTKKSINACLYHNPALFKSNGESTPKWENYE